MFGRLSKKRVELQERLVRDLGGCCEILSPVEMYPLVVKLNRIGVNIAIYIFPNTNPPGGRSKGEYKFNIKVPGQKPGQRGDFDYTLGIPLLISYTELYDVYIIYDSSKHTNFAWSSNIQSRIEFIRKACEEGMAITYKTNKEKLVGVTSGNLINGIYKWLKD